MVVIFVMPYRTTQYQKALANICLFMLICMLSACGGHKSPVPEQPLQQSGQSPQQSPEQKTENPFEITKENCLQRLKPDEFPLFTDDMLFQGLHTALQESIAFYGKIPANRPVRFGTDIYTASHMLKSCEVLQEILKKNPTIEEFNQQIYNDFAVYKSIGARSKEDPTKVTGKVLFTGYYEPLLYGSYTKSDRFSVPLHGVPHDLKTIDLSLFGYKDKKIRGYWNGETFLPYHSSDAINYANALKGKAPVLLYVDSLVDKLFLQIQGSGSVLLDNGQKIRVGYAGQNGREYRPVGNYLVQEKGVPQKEMSLQRIEQYFAQHPQETRAILKYNPSYVFFRIADGGVLGALGVPLTGGRSLAIDRRLFPDGAPAFIQTQKPHMDSHGNIVAWQDFSRFMTAQDTGGAIRGSGRADIFCGNGRDAKTTAGHMKHSGNMYFLALKKDTISR